MMASEPATAHFWLLGASDSMIDQSYKHSDGTGLAHYVDHRPIVQKHPIAAYRNQDFVARARRVRSHLFVAHVRYATQGRSCLDNTQPFADDSLVFAHNGHIEGLENLPLSLGPFRGDTDSEQYFAVLRHYIEKALNIPAGIRKAVEWITENCTYASLNFLLADGDFLYALRFPGTEDPHLFVRRLEAGEDFRGQSLYGSRTECCSRHGAILFASEPIDSASSWRELEPETLAVADRDLRLELHHI
jgi:glutamine amidotransferase